MAPRKRSATLRSSSRSGPRGERAAQRASLRPRGTFLLNALEIPSIPNILKPSLAGLSTSRVILWACVVRLFLIVWGIFQDAHAEVPYTDIDYQVYSDAARFVCEGASPYARSTYRYTPLLAWLLTPNCIFPSYGKVLFSVCDIMAAMLMLRERESRRQDEVAENVEERKPGNDTLAILIWLFSPFTATISTRGSGESLVVCMLMGMLVLLEKKRTVWAAVLYGIAVHWRIFPIVFVPSILLYLGSARGAGSSQEKETRRKSSGGFLAAYVSVKGVLFGVVSAGVFFGLGAAMHGLYGKEFLDETYLYHLTRVDPRHNFSFYFYPAYLQMHEEGAERDMLSTGFSLAGLAVQLLVADRMMRRHETKDLAMAFLAQSVAFVAFNKVSTAQYFVWYLCWFCVRLERAMDKVDGRWVVLWPAALVLWLFWAYLLEFRGLQVHLFVWMAGLVWFWVNVGLLRRLLVS